MESMLTAIGLISQGVRLDMEKPLILVQITTIYSTSMATCYTCAVGYYYDYGNAVCVSCATKITNCGQNASSAACGTCATGYYLASGN